MELYDINIDDVFFTNTYGFLQRYKHMIPNESHISKYVVLDFDVYLPLNENCKNNNNNNNIVINYSKYKIITFHELIDKINNSFMDFNARLYNMERIRWIDSLNIDFNGKNVFEIGCGGCGDFTRFLYNKGAILTSIDARQECLNRLISRLSPSIPNIQKNCVQIDVENIQFFKEALSKSDKIDIIVCVGLLYHINNPLEFLEACKSFSNILVLETMISNRCDTIEYTREDVNNMNQSFSGCGNLLNKDFLYTYLKSKYNNVDISKQPDSVEIHSGKRFTYYCY